MCKDFTSYTHTESILEIWIVDCMGAVYGLHAENIWLKPKRGLIMDEQKPAPILASVQSHLTHAGNRLKVVEKSAASCCAGSDVSVALSLVVIVARYRTLLQHLQAMFNLVSSANIHFLERQPLKTMTLNMVCNHDKELYNSKVQKPIPSCMVYLPTLSWLLWYM